jgi:hypothetical protein
MLPVLKPHLDLSRAQARYFPRQSLAMGSIRMCLPGKLAHQEARLIVGETI